MPRGTCGLPHSPPLRATRPDIDNRPELLPSTAIGIASYQGLIVVAALVGPEMVAEPLTAGTASRSPP
jgi:hypothetical protein